MSSEDWYRNKDWNIDIEEYFYEKLGRARSQRYQYIVIQALSLADSHPNVTLRLVEEYFETREDQYEDARALLARAKAYTALEQKNEVVATYKELLAREDEFSKHQTTAYLDYPYFVVTHNIESEYHDVSAVLKKHIDRLTFPSDYFIWHACFAIIEQSSSHATKALDAAKIKRSGFQFHQDVGLVGKKHSATIKKLNTIGT